MRALRKPFFPRVEQTQVGQEWFNIAVGNDLNLSTLSPSGLQCCHRVAAYQGQG
jgi:hypothetical protein